MKKILTFCLLPLMVSGCSSVPNNYQLYAETQKAIAQANAVAETARFIPSILRTSLHTVDFPAPLGPETTNKFPFFIVLSH